MKIIKNCLSLAKEYGDRREVAYCLNTLGNAFYYKTDDHQLSLDYRQEALKLYTELNDTHYVAWLHQRIGACYLAMKQGGKFREFMTQSFYLMNEKGDAIGTNSVLIWMNFESNFDLIVRETEDNNIADKIGFWDSKSLLDIQRSRLLFFEGRFEEAYDQIEQILKSVPDTNPPFGKRYFRVKASAIAGLIAKYSGAIRNSQKNLHGNPIN